LVQVLTLEVPKGDFERRQRAGLVDAIIDPAAPEPVRLVPIPKRRPIKWLRSYRDLCERLDLRVVDALELD
jgi:hypothetical protein